MGFTSPESIIQLSSRELSQPGHVAQEAAWFFGERRPLWLPPLIKSTTCVAPQVQGSTSTSLAGDSDAKTDFEGMVEEFLLQYLCFTSYVSFVDTFLGCDLPGS